VRSTANRAAGKARKTTKRATTKRSKKR
jgi:hypothetical protein